MYALPTVFLETRLGHSTVRQVSQGLLWRLVIVVPWTQCLFVCLLLQYRRNFVSGTDLQIGLGSSVLPQNQLTTPSLRSPMKYLSWRRVGRQPSHPPSH